MIRKVREHASHWAQDGRLYAVLSACGFSLKAVFVKLAYAAGPVEPLTLLALRMAFALPLFLWLIWKSSGPEVKALTVGDVGRIFALACLGYYLSSLFDFYGLRTITAGLERLILYLYPTLVLLLQAWRTRHWPHRRAWQAMAICYTGLAVAFANDLHQAGHGAEVLIGSAWVFGSAVSYALYYFGTGEMVSRIGSMRLSGLAGSASCLLVLAHFLLFGHPQALASMPSGVWSNAALMAVLSTTLPIYWLALAIQRLGAGNAAAVGTLGPVMTVLAAWLLLGESLSVLQLAGLALVMFGVMRLKPAPASQKTANAALAGQAQAMRK